MNKIENSMHLCRTCLSSENIDFINLFESKEPFTRTLADILKECSLLEVNIHDELSHFICKNCALLTKQCFEFKELCRKSNNELRKFLDLEEYKILVKNNDSYETSSINNEEAEKQEDKPNNYQCQVCNKLFITKRTLQSHTTRIHKSINCKFDCIVCGKLFNNKSNLNRHMLIHSNKRPFKCKYCSADFIQNVQLQDHTRRHHTFEKPYSCNLCEKKYVAQNDLKLHLETHSTESNDQIIDNKYICGICKEEYESESKLKFHKISHRKNCHLCSNCGKCFTTKRGLRTHQELHNEKTIDCTKCKKTFASARHLLMHNKSHESKKYLCNLCGNKYSSKHGLNTHMNIHSNIRPFVCDVEDCNKSFRFKNSLKCHILTHTKEKKYSCSDCGKQFAQSGHLFYHKQFHKGLKPFSCNFCDKSFTIKSNFNSHMKRHTGSLMCNLCRQNFFDLNSLNEHKRKNHCKNL